jgi:transposase-like protein
MDLLLAELLDNRRCTLGLARYLQGNGCNCPRCGSTERRVWRAHGPFPASRCRACEGDDTRLTGTVFEKTRQRPATRVLLRRGMAKGEPTARLARELGVSRKPLHTLRQRLQAHRHEPAPTELMTGTAFEADERSHHVGATQHASSRPRRSAPPACA